MKPGRMELLSRSDIDDERWNALVKQSPCFRHYGLTYFMDATAPDWKGLIGGDYEWVWPLAIKKWPVPRIYQPLLAQQLGPFGLMPLNNEELSVAWQFLSHRFWSVSVKFTDVYEKLPFPANRHLNVELDLQASGESIVKGYKRNVVSNIKKAEKAGLHVERKDGEAEAVIERFRIERGKDIRGLNGAFYRHAKAIYRAFAQRGEAETWVARLGGEPVAGVILLKTNNRLLNFFTASSSGGRESGAMHALFNAIILEHVGKANSLDFEGSNTPGLAFFYRSFGGRERIYLQAMKARVSLRANRSEK